MLIKIKRTQGEVNHLRQRPELPPQNLKDLVLQKEPPLLEETQNPVTRIQMTIWQKNGTIHSTVTGSRETGISPRELQYWALHLLGTLEYPLPEIFKYQSLQLEAEQFIGGRGPALKTLRHTDWWNHIEPEEIPELLKLPWFTDGKSPAVAHILHLKGYIKKEHLEKSPGSLLDFIKHMGHGQDEKCRPKQKGKPQQKEKPDWSGIDTRAIRFTPDSLRKLLRNCLQREPRAVSAHNLLTEKLLRLPQIHSTRLNEKEKAEANRLLTIIHEEFPKNMVTEEDNMPFPSWFEFHGLKASLKQIMRWTSEDVDWNQAQALLESIGLFPEFTSKNKTPSGVWRPWMAMTGLQKEAFQKQIRVHTLSSILKQPGGMKAIHGIALTNNIPRIWLQEETALTKACENQHLVWETLKKDPLAMAEVAGHKTEWGTKAKNHLAQKI